MVERRKIAVHVVHSRSLSRTRGPTIEKLRQVFQTSPLWELVSFEIVSDYEPDVLTASYNNIRHLIDISTAQKKGIQNDDNTIDKIEEQPNGREGPPTGPPFDELIGPLYVKQASNALKHYAALKRIADEEKEEGEKEHDKNEVCHLIVEDDVFFRNDVDVDLHTTVNSPRAPSDWEVLFLGLPSSKPIEENIRRQTAPREGEDDNNRHDTRYESLEDMYAYFDVGTLPACDSYIVSRKGARKLVSGYLPVRFPTNVHLAWRIGGFGARHLSALREGKENERERERKVERTRRCFVRTYTVSPNVFLDGSKIGLFVSTLNVNNRLIWNKAYMSINAFVQQRAATPLPPSSSLSLSLSHSRSRSTGKKDEESDDTSIQRRQKEQTIEEMIPSLQYQSHPDMMYLVAKYHMSRGRHQEGARRMADAYKVYAENGAIMSKESAFLSDYFDACKYIQGGQSPP